MEPSAHPMSAMDDATRSTRYPRPPRAWPRVVFALLAGGFLGVGVLGLLLERLVPAGDPLWQWGPSTGSWVALLAAGTLAGAALGLALCVPWLPRRLRPPRRGLLRGVPASLSPFFEACPAVPRRDPRRAWDAELGWLHVVCGPDPARIAQAVNTLAGGFLERGDRVLLLDAGERLRLHERYGADTRWGLGECLAGEVPLLGAVQVAGRSGFFFLAHGTPWRSGGWNELSGLLEEAQAHFGRVLLALDPQAPRAAALPLGGRVLEAWWAEPGPALPRRATALSDRLGIPFACLNLDCLAQAMLEPGSAAAQENADLPRAAEEVARDRIAALPLAGPEAGDSDRADSPEPSAGRDDSGAGPLVLDCDPDVRQRLRFLVWMRRVQAERRAVALGAGTGR